MLGHVSPVGCQGTGEGNAHTDKECRRESGLEPEPALSSGTTIYTP